MKLNKKRIGLIIALVCILICAIVVLVTMCDPLGDEQLQETSQPTDESSEVTEETTLPTGETTEPSEETTEPTEESTEATEEKPGKVVTTNNSIGSPGSTGNTTDATDPTEPKEEVILDPGIQANPYTEVATEYPSTMTTVKIPASSTMYYNVFNTDGATLTIADPDAYVICNGSTYEAVDGVVTVKLDCSKDTPASMQIGNKAKSEKAFELSFTAPLGAPCNPEILGAIDEVKATVEAGNSDGYSYSWTASEDVIVTFGLNSVTEGVTCDVILTAGDHSVSLSENGKTVEIPVSSTTDETTGGTAADATISVRGVSIYVPRGEVLSIQVLAPQNAQGTQYPAAEVTLSGSSKLAYQLVENVPVTVGKNTVALGEATLAYVFRFQPTAAGIYTFAANKAEALLSYWGMDESAMTNLTDTTDYDVEKNTFTITVDANSVGKTYLIGVSGSGSCVLTISK